MSVVHKIASFGNFPIFFNIFFSIYFFQYIFFNGRALRVVVYRDYNATFSELISKVTIHHRNLQLLGTETFMTKNEMNPVLDYNLRNNTSLKKGSLCLLWNRIFNLFGC